MSETPTPTPAAVERQGDGAMAIFAAILLGLAATLTAFSAYQAALRDGEALAGYNEASAKLSDSNYFYAQGNQTYATDQALFVEYATTAQANQLTAADYLRTLMRPELLEAVDWWTDDPEAITPFDEDPDNPYLIAEFAEAEALAAESQEANDRATEAGDIGDKFELSTVLLALTLFFAGIATLFRRRLVSWSLLGVALVSLVAGAVQLGTALTA